MRGAAGPVGLWAPVSAYAALIFAGSSISGFPQAASGISDKLLHVVVYAGLAVVLVRALSRGWTRPVTTRIAFHAVLIATMYGVSDEFHQSFVPNRDVEALDLVADAAGATLAAVALWAWGIIRGRDGL